MLSGEFPRIQFYPIIEVFSENVTNSKINFIKKPPSTFNMSASLENLSSTDTFENQGASAVSTKNHKSICRFVDENGNKIISLSI
jgi:hypothetical protein